MAINQLSNSLENATIVLRTQINQALVAYSEVVHGLEQTVCINEGGEFDIVGSMNQHVMNINTMIDKLNNWVRIYPALQYYIEEVYELTDELTEDFFKWAHRQTLSVKEYAAKVGKSVSTIYRWIKQGKLIAARNPNNRNRWVIACV